MTRAGGTRHAVGGGWWHTVGALPGEYHGRPVSLIAALLACLTAPVIATFATVGTFQVARIRPRPT